MLRVYEFCNDTGHSRANQECFGDGRVRGPRHFDRPRGLSVKQLLLLQGGTATTLRRRVARLIELGFVVRIPNQTDGRSDLISISPVVHGRLGSIDAGLKQIIEEFEARAAEQPVGDLDPLA
jgi:DNA-binding MarR family transcriptional regulator